ncbi:hypothetical protein FQN50_000512 [Emmonsiellopsis sp. PD_5]|nr:hypothetical protein FQN50_000512 [Emmonsiellopsis sp. PD_5]
MANTQSNSASHNTVSGTQNLAPSSNIHDTPSYARGGTPRLRRRRAKLDVIRKLKFSDAELRFLLGEMESSGSLILDKRPEYVRQFVEEHWLTEPEAAQVLWKGVERNIIKLLQESKCKGLSGEISYGQGKIIIYWHGERPTLPPPFTDFTMFCLEESDIEINPDDTPFGTLGFIVAPDTGAHRKHVIGTVGHVIGDTEKALHTSYDGTLTREIDGVVLDEICLLDIPVEIPDHSISCTLGDVGDEMLSPSQCDVQTAPSSCHPSALAKWLDRNSPVVVYKRGAGAGSLQTNRFLPQGIQEVLYILRLIMIYHYDGDVSRCLREIEFILDCMVYF